MATHPIKCFCGKVRGDVDLTGTSSHAVCYCKDCRAFARFLKDKNGILDANGGTELIQISPSRVRFNHGAGQLAAVRLKPKGLLRWYTKCCGTPIGNTVANSRISFVGLVHNCLSTSDIDKSFGPITCYAYTENATGLNPPKNSGFIMAVLRVIKIVGKSYLMATFKFTPFFEKDGRPIVKPEILDKEEVERLKALG